MNPKIAKAIERLEEVGLKFEKISDNANLAPKRFAYLAVSDLCDELVSILKESQNDRGVDSGFD